MSAGGDSEAPVRPSKSPARGVAELANDFTQAGKAKSSEIYNQAPDLGVTSTAQAAYEKAPNMGITGALGLNGNRDDGEARNGDSTGGASHGPDGRGSNGDAGQQGEHNSGEEEGASAASRVEISKQRGPTSDKRLNKSQKELGTETGIPTAAGAGTTVSPDATNQQALESEKSKGNVNKASVPEDYVPEPCPTENAGAGRADDVQKSADNVRGLSSKGESSSDTSGQPAADGKAGHARNSSGASGGSADAKRGLSTKVKDQVKGEIKVLKGSITNNDDKVNQGLSIKRGEGA